MKFSKVIGWRIPDAVQRVRHNGTVLWKTPQMRIVSLGDSIPAGHAIDAEWETSYGTKSQYGVNGNQETAIVPGCYTDLILQDWRGKLPGKATAVSFARSGDRVSDLMGKLDHNVVRDAIANADCVTICIGANDILGPAQNFLEKYIDTGDLSELEATVETNLAILADDANAMSYNSMFNKLEGINPNAKYVFTTIYNPYKYLWLDEGNDGFFSPLLDTIPQMTILGFEADEWIKRELLSTPAIEKLYSRVNGIGAWAEIYVTKLNNVLRDKINAFANANVMLADTKAVYDPVPDRPIEAPKHYNNLVNVEFTRSYNVEKMDWDRLYDDSGDAATFWWDLTTKYVSLSGLDINGLADELGQQTLEKVIVPNADPHPEWYGHYALQQSFYDSLGWTVLPRRTITFDANGGTGSMDDQVVVALDDHTAFTNIKSNSFGIPADGYRWIGWKDRHGNLYTENQFVGLNEDLELIAQWSKQ